MASGYLFEAEVFDKIDKTGVVKETTKARLDRMSKNIGSSQLNSKNAVSLGKIDLTLNGTEEVEISEGVGGQ